MICIHRAARPMKWVATARAAAVLMALPAGAAMANLVNNGSFEATTPSSPYSDTISSAAVVPSWTSGYLGGEALVSPKWFSANCYYCTSSLNVTFAGVTVASSPDGGNFVFADANYLNSPLKQVVSGLTPGASYQLSFYQALAQAQFSVFGYGTPGAVSANWLVALGSGPAQASTVMNANGATLTWAPWNLQTMTFTAANATEVLSFVSVGSGDPPALMLDGVTLLAAVPEPTTGAMLLLGGLAAGGVYRRRQLKDSAAVGV
jgi:hypothetical protein